MPREFHRSKRVEEQIQRLLVDLIRREVRDPRVGSITITHVEVSRDLSHAKVQFLPFDSTRPAEEIAEALRSASGFLRVHMKKHLQMRQVPELHFSVDTTIDKAARLSSIINAAVASDAALAAAHPAPEPTDDAPGSDEPVR
jgi:ribosome-binding factor A